MVRLSSSRPTTTHRRGPVSDERALRRRLVRAVSPPVPLGRRAMHVILGSSAAGALVGAIAALMSLTLPEARAAFGLTDGQMNFALGVARAGALGAIFLSAWSDRGGRRTPLVVALVMASAAAGLIAVTPTIWAYVGLLFVVRAAAIGYGAVAHTLVAEEAPAGSRAWALSAYSWIGAIGAGMATLAATIADRTEWAWRALYAGGALSIFAVASLRRVPESRRLLARERRPQDGTIREVWARHRRDFVVLAVIAFLLASFSSPALSLVAERLTTDLGYSAAGRSLLLLLTGAIATPLGLIAGGRLADVYGRRPVGLTCGFIGILGGVLFYTTSGFGVFLGLTLGNLGTTAFGVIFVAFRTELFSTRLRAAAGGWIANAGVLGTIVSLLAGWPALDLLDWSLGQYVCSTAVLGALAVVMTATMLPETAGLELEQTSGEPVPAAEAPHVRDRPHAQERGDPRPDARQTPTQGE